MLVLFADWFAFRMLHRSLEPLTQVFLAGLAAAEGKRCLGAMQKVLCQDRASSDSEAVVQMLVLRLCAGDLQGYFFSMAVRDQIMLCRFPATKTLRARVPTASP